MDPKVAELLQTDEVLQNFKSLIDDETQPESAYQAFLEQNTKLFHTPHTLHHGVHLEAVISQFRLDTTLTPDFAYLTKSSVVYQAVFVEIKTPHEPLLTKRGSPSSELTNAIHQVENLRRFCARNGDEVRRRLDPLKNPMSWNQMEFRYALVMGRSKDFANSGPRADTFKQLERSDFRLLTYDSLISAYAHLPHRQVLNVLTIEGGKFRPKYLHKTPESLLTYVSSADLEFSKADEKRLRDEGYDFDSWLAGERLQPGGKTLRETLSKITRS